MFGVLNKKVRMHERTSYNVNSDAVAYYAYDGNVYGVGNKQGNGFTTNDVVTMKVNLKEGVVQWSVNAVNKASANC